MADITKLSLEVYNILKRTPKNMIDPSSRLFIESDWQLVTVREDGSRNIGSNNINTADNIIALLVDKQKELTKEYLVAQVYIYLQTNKLIRINPIKVRQTFRVVK